MQRVVLVGGSGFVGRHLRKKLKDTVYETVVVQSIKNLSLGEIKILFRNLLKENDVVVNLIGCFKDSFSELLRANVSIAEVLCEICCEKKVRKIIHISAAAVYGDKKNSLETDSSFPTTLYGVSKLFGEQVITYFSKKRGLPYIILRPVNLYGQNNENGVIGKFLSGIKTGKLILYGSGMQTRDFLYIDDFIYAIYLSIQTKKVNNIFNVSSGKSYSLIKVITLFEKLKKRNITVIKKPMDISVTKSLSANNKKIKKELLWEPKISLEQGLRLLIAENE